MTIMMSCDSDWDDHKNWEDWVKEIHPIWAKHLISQQKDSVLLTSGKSALSACVAIICQVIHHFYYVGVASKERKGTVDSL